MHQIEVSTLRYILPIILLIRLWYSILDLSFNLLHSVPECVEKLVALRTVYFVQNRISRIDRLSTLGANLRSLELGGNRIRVRNLRSALVMML